MICPDLRPALVCDRVAGGVSALPRSSATVPIGFEEIVEAFPFLPLSGQQRFQTAPDIASFASIDVAEQLERSGRLGRTQGEVVEAQMCDEARHSCGQVVRP